jgi:carboxymethylenebutenolidase
MPESTLTLDTEDGPMDAFLVEPDGPAAPLGVVVVQGAFGVNAHIKDVTRRFAAEGFPAADAWTRTLDWLHKAR